MAELFRPTKPHAMPPEAEIAGKDGKPHVRIRDGKQVKPFPLTADGKRYLRPLAKWCAEVVCADGKRRRVRFSANKDAAAMMPATLLKEIEQEKAGIRRPAPAGSTSTALSALLTEYRRHAADRDVSTRQAEQAVKRCETAFAGCEFLTLADLDPAPVDGWLGDRRRVPRADGGVGPQTSNHYVTSLNAFGNWLVKSRRATENPFRYLTKVNVEVDTRHERRPLTAEEFDRMLAAAVTGRLFRGVPGPDRVVLYTVAGMTGLRASELASLIPASFALDADTPSVTVEAAYSKHKRRDTVPLHPDLTATLRSWLAGKGGGALLWPGKRAKQFTAAKMLKIDLAAARANWIGEVGTDEERDAREQSDFLAYEDAAGGKADFHALRHKFITELVKAGVQPKDAKELARHSTITLTMDRYAHVTLKDTAAAVSKLTGPMAGRSNTGAADGGNGRERMRIWTHRCRTPRPSSNPLP